MKKLFVALVVAALFAPLSFAEEVKKKDSFAGVGTPTNFAMAIASTEEGKNTCYNQGDIGIDKNGLILSCQSGGSLYEWMAIGGSDVSLKEVNGYAILPSGLIIQWGAMPAGTAVRTAYYKTPFKTACLNAMVTQIAESSAKDAHERISSCTKESIVGRPSSLSATLHWMAIGY